MRELDDHEHGLTSDAATEDFLARLSEIDTFIATEPAIPEPAVVWPGLDGTSPSAEPSEAEEFVQRLGELDQFIAATTPVSTTDGMEDVATTPADDEAEHLIDDESTSDFLQRLSDLDRFTG